jgi:hypothetical protein
MRKICISRATAPAAPPRGGAGYLTTAAEESHQLNSAASWATILNDVVALTVRSALFNLHCLFANKAGQQINQRAFIVIQTRFFRHPSHFQPFISTSSSFPVRLCGLATEIINTSSG